MRRERDPALLEYADRGVFRVHVYPIEGHSRKQVKISYTEVLKADSGLVSYTYPLNTEKFSSAPIHDVSVRSQLNSDRPLTSIYSPTHDVEIKRPDAEPRRRRLRGEGRAARHRFPALLRAAESRTSRSTC